MGFLSVEMYQFFSSPCFRQESQKQKMHRIATHTHTQESYIEWIEAEGEGERNEFGSSIFVKNSYSFWFESPKYTERKIDQTTDQNFEKIKSHLASVSYKFLAHRHSPLHHHHHRHKNFPIRKKKNLRHLWLVVKKQQKNW